MSFSAKVRVKKNILYICSGRSFYRENLSRKIEEVVNCWRGAGFEVKNFCGGDIVGDGLKSGVSYGAQTTYTRWYRKVPGFTPLVTSLSERRDIKHDSAMLLYLRGECEKWKPEIIWERSCRLHNAGLVLARELNVPYVLEWKDHLVDYRFSFFRTRALRLEVQKNQGADFIVVESEILRNKLVVQGIDCNKIFVAHNAVNAAEFSRERVNRKLARQKLGVKEDTILVGYLGSYAFYHDTERLILAAKILRDEGCNGDIRILMVGAGKEYEHSRRLAAENGLLDKMIIMMPGVPKDEVPEVLAGLDIAVLPGSTDIICPIKIQEYMACGLPSVVPDYKCNREVIEDGHTGVLFKPHDARALAGAIRNLAENVGLRERMGKQARQEVQRRFTWDATWGTALNTIINDVCFANPDEGRLYSDI